MALIFINCVEVREMKQQGFGTSELLAMLAACMVFVLLIIGSFEESAENDALTANTQIDEAYQATSEALR